MLDSGSVFVHRHSTVVPFEPNIFWEDSLTSRSPPRRSFILIEAIPNPLKVPLSVLI